MNANLVKEAGGIAGVLAVALAYGGIVQVLAGMWEFRTGNTFGAVAFSSYGAFWISYFVLVKITLGPTTSHSGISLYLYAWTIFTALMLVASLRTSSVSWRYHRRLEVRRNRRAPSSQPLQTSAARTAGLEEDKHQENPHRERFLTRQPPFRSAGAYRTGTARAGD